MRAPSRTTSSQAVGHAHASGPEERTGGTPGRAPLGRAPDLRRRHHRSSEDLSPFSDLSTDGVFHRFLHRPHRQGMSMNTDKFGSRKISSVSASVGALIAAILVF